MQKKKSRLQIYARAVGSLIEVMPQGPSREGQDVLDVERDISARLLESGRWARQVVAGSRRRAKASRKQAARVLATAAKDRK
jgi:hypothetical protein